MALYRVDPTTGMRTLLSDSNNPAEGPTGGKANGLAVHPGLGILASACSVITPAGRFVASICTVDAVKGHRALLSDFNDPSLGETFGNGPISIAVIPAPVLTGRLTASVSPPGAGSISPPSGIYTLAANLSMKASANPGFVFSSFSGALSGSTNPQNLSLNANSTVVANFTPVAPRLSASVGMRTDGVTPGTRVVPLSLLNSGAGAATNATITSISGIAIVAGSGVVSIASGLPVNLGTIAPGASASAQIIFNWPATAARVRMTVNYKADAGYSGSATITSFR